MTSGDAVLRELGGEVEGEGAHVEVAPGRSR
jgi:hypothetical protein